MKLWQNSVELLPRNAISRYRLFDNRYLFRCYSHLEMSIRSCVIARCRVFYESSIAEENDSLRVSSIGFPYLCTVVSSYERRNFDLQNNRAQMNTYVATFSITSISDSLKTAVQLSPFTFACIRSQFLLRMLAYRYRAIYWRGNCGTERHSVQRN